MTSPMSSHLSNTRNPSLLRTLYTASMSKIEAIDEYTVKITTSAPYAGLLYDLAYYYNYIVPKALIDANNDFSANPVGTGPYKLKEWNLGNYISLERHDDYFDEAHQGQDPQPRLQHYSRGDFPYDRPKVRRCGLCLGC